MVFSGAVLAGGRSSRFGQDKALYRYRGKPLAEWVLASLSPAAERFIVANAPLPLGVSVYPDIYPGSALGGLHAALTHAAHAWVALAACDMPFLRPDYWLALAAFTDGAEAVVVRREGRLEPLAAFYHRSLLPRAEAQLRTGQLRLQSLLEASTVKILEWDTLGLPDVTLLNANHLGDLPADEHRSGATEEGSRRDS